ncbi:MAG: TRAFAC clade GTPase domain-containing protein, partial [Micromonosporaceae bacterium]
MRIPVLVLLGVATVFLWWVLWPALAVTAGMVFVAAVTGFTVRLLGSSWRVLTSRHTDGPSPAPPDSDEPAFSRYLVTQVWRDHLAVLADTLSTASRPAMLLGAGATKALLGGWQAFALAPLWLVVAAGLLTGAVGCLVVMALVFAGQAATVAVAGGAQLLGVAAVRGLDGLLVSVRRTRPACPHPGCYRSFTRPEHACSRCGAAHRKLAAGRHGVLRRVCRCGALLPTSVLLGRNRLHAACPHCHRPLPGSIGHAPLVHLPIVGGPAAGKSTYTHLAVGALRQHAGRVRFADPDEAEAFASRLAALRAGKEAPRTPVELPQATTLDVELTGAGRCLMYLFDPPGEHYTSADRIGWQRYLDHADTLLLVVDP